MSASPAAPVRRARLARYALWQLRDFAVGRGLPTLLIAGMFGGLAVVPIVRGAPRMLQSLPPRVLAARVARLGSVDAVRAAMIHDVSTGFLRGFIGTVIFLGALFAMNGLVANDRKLGYYRFQFSKPVSPVRFYGQAFLLHWAGFLAVMLVLGVAYGAYVERILTPAFLAVVALVWLMYAGIAFLMTTFVRWDWLGLTAVVVAAQLFWDKFADASGPARVPLYLLPPIHRTGDVFAALFGAAPLPWGTVAWMAGYGAVCFLAGLAILRTQRLAIP